MKKCTSLSTRTTLLLIAGIAVFSLTLILILHFSSNRLLYNWQEMETKGMYEYVEQTLSELIVSSISQNKGITNTDITSVLKDFPYLPNWLIITDLDYNVLYFYRQNGSGRQMQNYMRHMQDITAWRSITADDGKTVLYYSIGVPEFTETKSNDTLIKSFRLALALACIASLILAFLASQFFSRRIKKQTMSLVAVLESIAGGARDAVIPNSSIKEFSQIASAAATLQDNLLREETIRRQWASDIAHDLRTPLTVLQGTIEGLIDGVFKADAQKLQTLNTQVKHLSSLVNALSLLSKLETPGYILHKEAVSLTDSLTNAVSFFSSQTQEKNMEITTNLNNVCINADPVLFERLISNLISNAVEYGLNGTEIYITAEKSLSSEALSLSISNYAELSEETVQRAFDRLYQGKISRTNDHSGLGLSIVQAIVKAHGWNISLQYDKDQKKVTFIIIFTKSLYSWG